ncbi:DNA binding domain-containing protein, excisionase family [Raineyella antarctica]|uniref:DNA binding domain-containing protein, excisionase family n=1 Tax=Raineyella antarctica TaxID=1577474 RepID=A0A1G6GEH5_9ACTN|nr:helix-turn-helix domain-containing protein [Raineyella antarctica]SDB80233.1 DNA binding domain-containing protein, excisionase family [Raineyella antarctica]
MEGVTQTRFVTVAEVAALMRVSRMSVYRLIHSGELEAVRFGRTFRIPQHAIDSYLARAQYVAAAADGPADRPDPGSGD